MIPVYQTRVGANGNCFAACLASILELPLSAIPEFSEDEWLDELAEFLAPKDLMYVQIHPKNITMLHMLKVGKAYHTIEGISTRGGPHATVGMNGKIVFDPHRGAKPPHLVKITEYGLLVGRYAKDVTRERLHRALDKIYSK